MRFGEGDKAGIGLVGTKLVSWEEFSGLRGGFLLEKAEKNLKW